MNYTDILGMIAGTLTTIAFIPQVIQVVKTKSTKDISLSMFVCFITGVLCWFAYGILTNTLPVIICNATVAVLAAIILVYKIKYK